MAKGIYIGADNIARKVKGMYVGVDGVAMKVKKAYIGVNDVARLFYSTEELITFAINGVSYQAVKGMSWSVWCDSEYNSNNDFACHDGLNTVQNTSLGFSVGTKNGVLLIYVTPNDVITEGTNYQALYD